MIKIYIVKHRGKIAVRLNDGKETKTISTGLRYSNERMQAYRRLLFNCIDLKDAGTIEQVAECINDCKQAIDQVLEMDFESVYKILYTIVLKLK